MVACKEKWVDIFFKILEWSLLLGLCFTYPVEFGKAIWVQLQPEKFKYLSKSQSPKSTCGQRSYYECIESELLEKIESNCSKKCAILCTRKTFQFQNVRMKKLEGVLEMFQ